MSFLDHSWEGNSFSLITQCLISSLLDVFSSFVHSSITVQRRPKMQFFTLTQGTSMDLLLGLQMMKQFKYPVSYLHVTNSQSFTILPFFVASLNVIGMFICHVQNIPMLYQFS